LWLHRRHEAGRWIIDLPEETLTREAFIAGAKDSGAEPPDPLAGITRLDVED
jgi:hypothetical protein